MNQQYRTVVSTRGSKISFWETKDDRKLSYLTTAKPNPESQ